MREFFALTDIHWENHNERAVAAVYNALADRSPDDCFVLGDLYTFDQFSRYRKDPRAVQGLQETLTSAREDFWKPLSEMVEKIYYTLGNHEERLYDYLQDNAPEWMEFYTGHEQVPYVQLLGFAPYVEEWVHYRHCISMGPFIITHGDRTGTTSAKSLLSQWGTSGLSGHTHKSSRHEQRTWAGRDIWQECGTLAAMNQGYNAPLNTDWHTGFAHGYYTDDEWTVNFIPVDERTGNFILEGKPYSPC